MSWLDDLPPFLREARPVQVLDESLERKRLPHAILLSGEELDSLRQVSRALGKHLLATSLDPEKHPDFFTLRPAKKARQIRIGDRNGSETNTMRRLLSDLQQSSNQGGYKVAVIEEADRMNAATANAFLKTLEEPPAQTLMLLLTIRPYDLLDTIRSRCFQFRLPASHLPVEEESWQSWIQDYHAWIHGIKTRDFREPANQGTTVLAMYGLIHRFNQILHQISGETWKGEKASLPDHLSDDEISALEVGVRKGIRNRLFQDIETATREAAIELTDRIPFPSRALSESIRHLEAVSGLLEVNLREDTALETYLLQALRSWARG